MSGLDKSQKKAPVPFNQLTFPEQIVEIFYSRANELCKPAFMAINREHPLDVRKENTRSAGRYAEAHAQIVQHRNHHKRIVKDSILPRCKIERYPTIITADAPTQRLKKLVAGQFEMVKNRLQDYAELIVHADDAPALISAIDKVYEREKNFLLSEPSIHSPVGIANYRATESPTIEQILE